MNIRIASGYFGAMPENLLFQAQVGALFINAPERVQVFYMLTCSEPCGDKP